MVAEIQAAVLSAGREEQKTAWQGKTGRKALRPRATQSNASTLRFADPSEEGIIQK